MFPLYCLLQSFSLCIFKVLFSDKYDTSVHNISKIQSHAVRCFTSSLNITVNNINFLQQTSRNQDNIYLFVYFPETNSFYFDSFNSRGTFTTTGHTILYNETRESKSGQMQQPHQHTRAYLLKSFISSWLRRVRFLSGWYVNSEHLHRYVFTEPDRATQTRYQGLSDKSSSEQNNPFDMRSGQSSCQKNNTKENW